eukprot:UN24221
MGGWKTDFSVSYDVPADHMISISPDDSSLHLLNISFGIPFSKPVADYMISKIALPEGAYDIDMDLPFAVDEMDSETRYTYLDSLIGGGRPVVYFIKTGVVREHFEYFQIKYRYSRLRILFKPILVIFGFLCFFASAAFLNRINLSLESSVTKACRNIRGMKSGG